MATVSEKIDYLSEIKTQKQYFRLANKVRNLAFDMASGKTYQYINLRQVLSRKMNQEGISRRRMAHAIGIAPSALSNFLCGRRSLPYKYVERILGLLYMDGDFVDKYPETD